MPSTRDLAEAVSSLTSRSLATTTTDAVRVVLLDHLGVAIGGSTSESAATFRRADRRLRGPGGPELPVMGTGRLAPAVGAAMANAVAAHSTEHDDLHNASSVHPGAVVFPSALAAWALAGATDDDVLLGVVVGYEVMCRVGRAANPRAHYARHFHPTATAGRLGAAAAAATVMRLDVDAVVSALGIAASMAAGTLQFLVDGSWTKRLHPALAARDGVEAAVLASVGFQGSADGIAGERGFLAAFTDDARPEEFVAEWGHRPLEVELTSVKAHACCRYNHAAIDAALALRSAHGLGGRDIVDVVVGVPQVAVDIVLEPAAAKRRPTTVVDAQFSLPYGIAAAFHDGAADAAQYTAAAIAEPDRVELTNRVRYSVDPELDAVYPEHWRAWVEVTTRDGRVLRESVDDPKGDVKNPLSDAEAATKFRGLCDGVVSEAVQQGVVDVVSEVGRPGWVGRLLGAFDR